jgi:hypothetical protein
MAAAAAQQAHGKPVDRSTYLVATSAAASFVDLDGERWKTTVNQASYVRRREPREGAMEKQIERGKKDAAWERRIRASSLPRKVTQNGGRFSKCVNFRRKY